ncbi:MAG: hypothetical protein R2734_10715 [Nocardioides sp.]
MKRRLRSSSRRAPRGRFYGATEGQFTACRSEDWATRPGTVGRARPESAPADDPDGTLWCRVPPYARFGYLGDPARTAAAWRQGPDGPESSPSAITAGWTRMAGCGCTGGAAAWSSPEASRSIRWRVEETLRGCPGVDDIAVYGVPDEEWGQRVCAAVVEDGQHEEGSVSTRASGHPRSDLGSTTAARPSLTATGKVRRQDLP